MTLQSMEPESTNNCSSGAAASQPVPTAVAHPCEASALAAVVEAAEHGLIAPILVGPTAKIEEIAKTQRHRLSGRSRIVDAPHSHASAAARPSNWFARARPSC